MIQYQKLAVLFFVFLTLCGCKAAGERWAKQAAPNASSPGIVREAKNFHNFFSEALCRSMYPDAKFIEYRCRSGETGAVVVNNGLGVGAVNIPLDELELAFATIGVASPPGLKDAMMEMERVAEDQSVDRQNSKGS